MLLQSIEDPRGAPNLLLETGTVFQVRRFDELANADGPFRELVRRQMSRGPHRSVTAMRSAIR